MWKTVAVIAVVAVQSVTQQLGAQATSVPWERYFGSQYRSTEWSGSVRGPSQLPSVASESPVFAEIHRLAGQGVQSLVFPGGLPSGGNPRAVGDSVRERSQRRGTAWVGRVEAFVRGVDSVAVGGQHVTWQLGNEVNSPFFSRALGHARGGLDDTTIIPAYANEYLAPTVFAIRHATGTLTQTGDSGTIVLGSIANAYNPKARSWLYTLLDYRLNGTTVPQYANKRVYELVNIISLHYLLTDAGHNWEQVLDNVWSRWVGKGRISGVWLTEEIGLQKGKANLGAVTALKVFGRGMSFWLSHDIPPSEGRIFFWGDNLGTPGTRGDDAMQALYATLDTSALRLQKGITPTGDLTGVGTPETYAFSTQGRPARTVVVVVGSPAQLAATKGIRIAVKGREPVGMATVRFFAVTGESTQTVRIGASGRGPGGVFQIRLPHANNRGARALLVSFATR